MRTFLAFLLISSVFPVAAETKHPFTFEDMMKLKRVEEPVVSPDGKWMLFAAVDVDLKTNTKTPHVWVVRLLGSSEPSSTRKDSQTNPSASLGITSPEKEIISDQDADRPRWAPDGKRFAFVSTKENESQIWIADFDGATGTVTAKHRLTNIATEADGELWSPDGKYILFKSDVYPECDGTPAEESACNTKRVQELKESKVKAQIFTHLLYRHWNAYKEGKRTHLFVVRAYGSDEEAEISLVSVARDLTPGDYDAPVFSLGGQDDYAFSSEGKEICYASNHDAMPAASTNNDLFTVPVNWPADTTSAPVLAATKDITAENQAADNTPLYSPDGKYIAYRAQARPGYESDRWRLMLYDRKTGEKTNLSENFDEWVGTYVWAHDSSRIYFVAEDKGTSPIYTITLKTKVNTEKGYDNVIHETNINIDMFLPGSNDDLAVTPDGNTVLFTRTSLTAPSEIYRTLPVDASCKNEPPAEARGKEECNRVARLIHLNDAVLSRVVMSPVQSFWFTGAHGDKVEGFLVMPPNSGPQWLSSEPHSEVSEASGTAISKKYPVKFLIHGGPQGAWGDDWSYRWNSELFAANGYVVVMINFHGSTGYGQKFIDAINRDWGGAPFEDLMKGLDYAEQHYPFIDKDRECALGASYGGWMANWILGHTNRFKCIVSHDGMFDSVSAWGSTEELWFSEWEFGGIPYKNLEAYRKWSPHLWSLNFKTPTLVIHGQRDYRLDVSEGFRLFTTLQRLGVASKMLYFPDEGHWVLKPQNSQLWYKTVNDWVDQWIGKRSE